MKKRILKTVLSAITAGVLIAAPQTNFFEKTVCAETVSRNSFLGFDGAAITNASGAPGETVTVMLGVQCGNSLTALNLGVKYDPELTLKSVNQINSNIMMLSYDDSNKGSIGIYFATYSDAPDGYFLSFDFVIPKNASPGKEYRVSPMIDIYTGIVSGSHMSSFGTVSGTITVTGNSSGGSNVKGDADGDGKLSVRDAAKIASMLAHGNGSALPINADFNGDGIVNIRDAAAIAKSLAK